MDINRVPKFVINLKRREDRLKRITSELKYMGWDYELFEGIDAGCHVGCTLSHLEIINVAKQRNYESVMVIEDDCSFMPYAKSLISDIEKSPKEEFAIFNLSPTLNRPVNVSEKNSLLLDLTNLPEKKEHHRDIFATNILIYNKSIYDDLFLITGNTLMPANYIAIDEFIFKYIISKKQSYSPILPIAPQISDWSDVSNGNYNNYYTQTYNWNLYSNFKIPGEYLDFSRNEILKKDNIHKIYKNEN